MTVAFFWIVFSIAVGVYASNRGRSGFGWFLLSALISPLLGLIFCAVSKDLAAAKAASAPGKAAPGEATHVKCPACAEWVLPEAHVCKHCGHALTPDPDFSDRQIRLAKKAARDDSNNLAIGVAFIFGLFLFAWLISRFG